MKVRKIIGIILAFIILLNNFNTAMAKEPVINNPQEGMIYF